MRSAELITFSSFKAFFFFLAGSGPYNQEQGETSGRASIKEAQSSTVAGLGVKGKRRKTKTKKEHRENKNDKWNKTYKHIERLSKS